MKDGQPITGGAPSARRRRAAIPCDHARAWGSGEWSGHRPTLGQVAVTAWLYGQQPSSDRLDREQTLRFTARLPHLASDVRRLLGGGGYSPLGGF